MQTEGRNTHLPHYRRSLDDFADHIIAHARQGRDGSWTAVLDTGFRPNPGDPDFATHGTTKESALEACARKIREDARGNGKFAPHAILVEAYALHFQLAPHWAMKERVEAQGKDPNEFVEEVWGTPFFGWNLRGAHLVVAAASRMLEAAVRLAAMEMRAAIVAGQPQDGARAAARTAIAEALERVSPWVAATDETHALIGERIDRAIDEPVPAGATP